MVFLRLTVKIFPRDQVSTASITSWSRSLLGGKGHSDDSKQAPAASIPAKKPGVFLLPIEKPDEINLGALAGLIQEKWSHLHPDLEPLAIKKIVDDTKEDTELYPELTVADVWVDFGKARADGHDQRGSVRVIQKSGTAAPERFPSVEQDWDAAVLAFKRKRDEKPKKEALDNRVSPIEEEDEDQSSPITSWHRSRSLSQSKQASKSKSASSKSPRNNYHHVAITSVESDGEPPQTAAVGITIAGTPPRRDASEELGESHSKSPALMSTKSSHSRTEPKITSHSPAFTRRAATPSVRKISQFPATQSASSSVSEHHPPDQPRETTDGTTPGSSSDDSQDNEAPTHDVEPPKSVRTNGVQASSQPSQVFDLGDSSEDESDESDSTSDEDSGENEDNKLESETVMKDGSEVTSSDESKSNSSDSKDETNNRPQSHLADSQPDKAIANKKNDDNVPDADGDISMEEDVPGSQPSKHAAVSRKRKKSTEEPVAVKEARVERAHPSARQISKSKTPEADPDVVFMHSSLKSPDRISLFERQSKSKSPGSTASQPVSPKSPRRQRAPSFSSPSRRLHYQLELEHQSPARKMKQGLGLDFSRRSSTNEPSHDATQDPAPRMSSQDSFGGSIAKSNAPTLEDSPSLPDNTKRPAVEQGKTKPSALRGKGSPQAKRLSVSFADGDTPLSQDVPPRSTPRTPAVISSRRPLRRTAISQANQATPPSSAISAIYPSESTQSTPTELTQSQINRGFDPIRPQEKIEEEKLRSLSKDKHLQPEVSEIIQQMIKLHKRMSKISVQKRGSGREQLAELRVQLDSLGLHLNPETSNNQEPPKIQKKPEGQETPKDPERPKDQETPNGQETRNGQKKPENQKHSGSRTSQWIAVNTSAKGPSLPSAKDLMDSRPSTVQNSAKRPSRPSLKGLMDSQKKEQAEKAEKARKAAQTARKPTPNRRPTVFDVPDGSESENDSDDSESQSDSGDIMPDGRSRKLQRPWSQRV